MNRGQCTGRGKVGNQGSQAVGTRAGGDGERERRTVPRQRSEARRVARVQPVEQLLGGDQRNAARDCGAHDRRCDVRLAATVRMCVGGEDSVVFLRSERAVEKRIDRERIGLLRLVRHLRDGLVCVDQRPVRIVGEAHRHRRTGEVTGNAVHPAGWPEVVIGVEADAVGTAHSRGRRPGAPGDTVVTVALRCADAKRSESSRKLAELSNEVVVQLLGREIGAARVEVQRDLEPLRRQAGEVVVGRSIVGVHVDRPAQAGPIEQRAARRALCRQGIEARDPAPGTVVIRGEDHGRTVILREVPEARQWLPVDVHVRDQVGEKALLLVGLRNGQFRVVDPVRLRVGRLVAEEQVVRADDAVVRRRRQGPVPVVTDPCWVALARVDDRGRKVKGERSCLATEQPHRMQRHRRMCGGGAGVGVQRCQPRSPVQRVQRSGTVELHAAAMDAAARDRHRIDAEVAVRQGVTTAVDAEQRVEIRVRIHRDQVTACADPIAQHRRLDRRDGHAREYHDVVGREERWRHRRDVRDKEGVQALGTQDLRVEGSEPGSLRRGGCNYQNGPARTLRGVRDRGARGQPECRHCREEQAKNPSRSCRHDAIDREAHPMCSRIDVGAEFGRR